MTKAFVFPGQGSQAVGMLSDSQPEVGPVFKRASDVLGYDLWELTQNGPEDRLNATEFTQPALLTASYALWLVARNAGLTADFVAGHSLGEYSALVASEVIAFEDAVSLVQTRGQLMQAAVPIGEGGMAAIMGLADDQVAAICEAVTLEADGSVEPANLNAPGQIVISGTKAALETACAQCLDSGAKRAVPLNVSAPFHSRLMAGAAEQMATALERVAFSAPRISVVQNVVAETVSDPAVIRNNLVAQMVGAVRWTESIQHLVDGGVETFIECGPGKVLSGLIKRIERQVTTEQVGSASAALLASADQ